MPKKYSRYLSYVTGWLACCGWFFGTAGCLLITSELVWALVNVCVETFIIQPWHFYMGYVAAGLFGILMNIPLFRIYPYMLNSLVLLVNGGALFVLIALLVRAHPKEPASYVFVDIVNSTGWSGNGVVFFIGLLPGITAVTGFDTASHLTDELPNPKKQVPQVMVGGAAICIASGIPMILVYMFCIVKPENLLTPVGGQPIIQLMLDSFDSLSLTIIGTLIFILGFGSTCATVMTVFTRTWWSFARENGIPFSGFMSRINEYWRLSVNAICFCTGMLFCLGLIELGSSTALNAILGGLILCLYSSYSLAIVGLLISRRKPFQEPHYFNLGKLGFFVNIISVGWSVMMIVWLSMPLYLPVTSASMNYASAVFGAVLLVSTINWFTYSRRIYKSPIAMYEE
jgi:amino acid transporter